MYYELFWYTDENQTKWACEKYKTSGSAFKAFKKMKFQGEGFYPTLTQYDDHECIINVWD